MPPVRKITATRYRILELLGDKKALTTSQIRQQLIEVDTKYQTWEQLDALRQMKLVRSRVLEREKGATSEYYWQLTRLGAEEIGLTYGRHFSEPKSRKTILFHSLELELERHLTHAGWKVVTPQNYGLHHPRPSHTEQYQKIGQYLSNREYARIQEQHQRGYEIRYMVEEYQIGSHLRVIPAQTNDYLAYTPEAQHACLFILCPAAAGEKFWKRRVEKYKRLAKVMRIYGVFEKLSLALYYKEQLKSAGLRATTLEKVPAALKAVIEDGNRS